MKTVQDLRQLLAVCETQYNLHQQNFAKLIAREHRLHSELARLNQMRRDTRSRDLEQLHMQSLGADVVWQGWLGRSKSHLNIDLARVLSEKAHYLAKVRLAYGKVLAVQQLLKETEGNIDRRRNSFEMDKAIQAILQAQF